MPDRPLITVEYDGPAELQPVVVAARNPLLRPGDRVTIRLDTQATPPRWLLAVHIAATGWQTTLTSERYAQASIDAQLVHLIADLVMLPLPPQQCPPVKCGSCGWVHVAIPRAVAEASAEDIEHYMKCFRCGEPTTQFVPAEDGDAPMGCTLQACVLP